MKFKKNILCIGAGYVGGPTMAVIAAKCPALQGDGRRRQRRAHPGLEQRRPAHLRAGAAGGRRRRRAAATCFSRTDIAAGIRAADIIFVSVNTPTKTFGHGAGMASDLQYWEKTAHEIVAHSRRTPRSSSRKAPCRCAPPRPWSASCMTNKKGIHFEVRLQPRVPGRGDGRQRPAGARPGADRLAADRDRAGGGAGDRRHLRPLGAARTGSSPPTCGRPSCPSWWPTPSWPSASPRSTPSPPCARRPAPTSARSRSPWAATAASAPVSSTPASASAAPASKRTS